MECKDCTVFVCPEECFNAHPGSMIAMKKLITMADMTKQRHTNEPLGEILLSLHNARQVQ